ELCFLSHLRGRTFRSLQHQDRRLECGTTAHSKSVISPKQRHKVRTALKERTSLSLKSHKSLGSVEDPMERNSNPKGVRLCHFERLDTRTLNRRLSRIVFPFSETRSL